jgi:diguanylate cyclase (GGDEF)-like protein/PAS domain S-box-containing protein
MIRRKAAERTGAATRAEELAHLEAELFALRTTLDNVGAYIYIKDRQGNYTFANRKVRELMGCTLAEIVGCGDEKFFDEADCRTVRHNDLRVLEHGEHIAAEERVCLQEGGSERIFWAVKSPLCNAQGEIVGLYGVSTDITERKQMEAELRDSRKLLQTILNNLDAFVYMKDQDLRFLYVNEKTAALFGRPVGEIIGRTNQELLPGDVAAHFSETDRQVFRDGTKVASEEHAVGADGVLRHYWSNKIPLCRDGKPYAYLGFSTDISELVRLKEEFHRQAVTDMLTGLHNRRFYMESARLEFTRAQRHGEPLSVIGVDVDQFKCINDRYGHHVGDVVLCAIADGIRSAVREGDLVGRIGGEEFAVLLPHTSLSEARALAHRICQTIGDLHLSGDWSDVISPTISLGVSEICAAECDPDAVMIRADRALYMAKDRGRNCVCCLQADGSELCGPV